MQPGSDRLRLVCFLLQGCFFLSALQVLLLGVDQLKQVFSRSPWGRQEVGGMKMGRLHNTFDAVIKYLNIVM